MTNKKVLIIAGEESGDMHGAALIKEIKRCEPDVKFFGIGGDRMVNEGLQAQFHSSDTAFLGFLEVVKHLPFILKIKKTILQLVKSEEIGRVILIDYPGFNLRIAKDLKAMGLDVIYYISPQLWAWNKKRIEKVKQSVDKMLVVFPFEVDFYRNEGVDVEFVGHPVIDRLNTQEYLDRKSLCSFFGLSCDKEYLLVMPGSRLQEIKRIYPEVKKAAKKISEKYGLEVIVACASNIDEDLIERMSTGTNFHIIKGRTYDLLKYAKVAIVKSGTSTLETALFGVPFVVVYKTTNLTYEIGKRVVKLEHIAMPNIVSGETVVEELIQHDVNEKKIYESVASLLDDEEKYKTVKEKLNGVRELLGNGDASVNAAKIICDRINDD